MDCDAARKPGENMIGIRSRVASRAGIFAWLILASGCVQRHYGYSSFNWTYRPGEPTSATVEYGTPGPALQRMAKVVDAPRKLLPASKQTKRHALSNETTELLVGYLEQNDLADVPVFVNHYDPGDQWRRLQANQDIAPLYRYTFGAGSVLKYTLLPNPVFGGNQYNPYTNSLYVETDLPIDVLYAAADAKNIHTRALPGAYLLVTSLPGLSLSRGIWATNDVLNYAAAQGDWETEREVYRVLYPRVGGETLALAPPPGGRWWISPLLRLSGSAAGRGVGHVVEKRRRSELGISDESPAQHDSAKTPAAELAPVP